MTDQDNTTDDPTRDELENRVEQLEQTVQQMLPSRRDALKLGGTALAAGALGSAATGSASAGTNSVGTVGSSGSPVDAELEDINPSGTRPVEMGANIDVAGQTITDSTGGPVDVNADQVDGKDASQMALAASQTDDGSDITRYTGATGTIVSISGSGFLIAGTVADGQSSPTVTLTVDGGTSYSFGGKRTPIITSAHTNPSHYIATLPPVEFSSSLDVSVSSSGSPASQVWVKQ